MGLAGGGRWAQSVLVVVRAVHHVAVHAVHVVLVARVADRRMAAARPVHVHVSGMAHVAARIGIVVDIVDMVAVAMMDVAVVQEVDMVIVRDGGMPAETVVLVRMLGGGVVGDRVGHRIEVTVDRDSRSCKQSSGGAPPSRWSRGQPPDRSAAHLEHG